MYKLWGFDILSLSHQHMRMTKDHISYDTIHAWTLDLAQQAHLDGFVPELVVGITRGGLLPAQILSHHYQVPMWCHHMSLRDHVQHQDAFWFASRIMAGERMLIVDDINDTGATLARLKEQFNHVISWSAQKGTWQHLVKLAVLIHKPTSSQQVDYHALTVTPEKLDTWWVFPWEKTG